MSSSPSNERHGHVRRVSSHGGLLSTSILSDLAASFPFRVRKSADFTEEFEPLAIFVLGKKHESLLSRPPQAADKTGRMER